MDTWPFRLLHVGHVILWVGFGVLELWLQVSWSFALEEKQRTTILGGGPFIYAFYTRAGDLQAMSAIQGLPEPLSIRDPQQFLALLSEFSLPYARVLEDRTRQFAV